MLNLTTLNEIIEKKEKTNRQKLVEQFLSFRDQIEQGITHIAEQGNRIGEITITTNSEIKTSDIEILLKEHYHPILFSILNNQTHNNPKNKLKSSFSIEVVIPIVCPNSTYGCNISE